MRILTQMARKMVYDVLIILIDKFYLLFCCMTSVSFFRKTIYCFTSLSDYTSYAVLMKLDRKSSLSILKFTITLWVECIIVIESIALYYDIFISTKHSIRLFLKLFALFLSTRDLLLGGFVLKSESPDKNRY